jgi:hypothetical protein
MEQAVKDRLQGKLDEQVKAHFADGGVQRVTLLQYGDDPEIEPGDLWIRVSIKAAEGPGDREQARDAWELAHKAMMNELQRELAEKLPEATRLEFSFGDNTDHRRSITMRIGGSLPDLAERNRDLTPVMARLGPVDLGTLDILITAGIAANRAEALRWALARIRERPAYAKLSQRARALDELKAQF